MIDTHSHLDGPEFAEDLEQTLLRAKAAGVEKIFVPGICWADTPRLLEICNTHAGLLYPMIGLHPENIMDEDYHEVLEKMERLIAESVAETEGMNIASAESEGMNIASAETEGMNIASAESEGMNAALAETEGMPYACKKHIAKAPIIGIGEVGLDLYWDDTHKSEQMEVLESQLQWAEKYRLPLMIHSRNAHAELMEIMERHRSSNLTGVFHCFTGTPDEARDLLSFPGFMLGIGGVVTFKKSTLRETIKEAVPLSRIVLETDSPYMAPVPNRGKRNESAYVKNVAEMLADVFGLDLHTIVLHTTKNALKVFPKAVFFMKK